MQRSCKLIFAVFASIAGIASGLHAASARDMTTASG